MTKYFGCKNNYNTEAMKYNGTIEAKLRIIEEKLLEIESWQIVTYQQLQLNSMLRNATERALQVAIESIIDICERILALEGVPAPETSADVVKKVIEMGIITDNAEYIDMIRFRNFIVHRYEKIDLEIIYAIVSKKLQVFRNFVHEIRKS
jgi:uncharacterized protein YutE (UPF0331/DUF86 family)